MQRWAALLQAQRASLSSALGQMQGLAKNARTPVALLRRQFSSQGPAAKSGFRWVAVLAVGTGAYVAYSAMQPDWVSSYDEVSSGKKKRVVVLGSGWGAAAVLKHLDRRHFEIVCVSPRNYFLMTPLLPSVTVGTVETRTVVEPIRKLVGGGVKFLEAECIGVDPKNKTITCVLPTNQNEEKTPTPPAKAEAKAASRGWFGGKAAPAPEAASEPPKAVDPVVKSSSRTVKDSARTRPPFELEYDVLVCAVGAENNTFNTPGVQEHAHFLKELPDAQRIRHAISDCFESAVVPTQSEEERKRLLHFVVVGGGPTGVEYAGELADYLKQDLKHYFGHFASEAKVTVIEAMDHVLSMMDRKISDMTEKQFQRENIELLANTFVKGVGQKEVLIQRKGSKEVESIPCALVVWATGIKPREIGNKIRKTIGLDVQNNFRGILTDGFLSVKGVEHGTFFALGDCATIEQPKLLSQAEELFKDAARVAPYDPSHTSVTLQDLKDLCNRKLRVYPQLMFLMDSIEKNFADADINKDGMLDIDEFHKLLEKADAKIRALPATAQVANQQGLYLARLLNESKGEAIPAAARPFRYRHLGSLAYIGGDAAVADFTGAKFLDLIELGPMGGFGTFLFWRGFYLSEMFTLRTKILLASDWFRTHVFGRDISRY